MDTRNILFLAHITLVFGTAANSCLVGAQEQAPQPIIVSGKGLDETPSVTAFSHKAIDLALIRNSPSGRVEDVLANTAGFQQFRRSDSRSSNPSAQGITLRSLGGNATSRALLLLDGVPLADPFFGYAPLSAIDPMQLRHIAITRGGGTGPFGSGALTGVIAMESMAGGDNFNLTLGALGNQRAETELSGRLAAPVGAGFIAASGRWDRGKGFYTSPVNERVSASTRAGFEGWNLGLRAAAPMSDTTEIQANLRLFRDQRVLRFKGGDTSSEGQDASIRVISRGPWAIDALAYVQARNFTNVVISATRFVPVLDQSDTPSTGVGGKIELRPPIADNHVLRLGVDYRRTNGGLQEEAYSAFSGKLTERRRAGGQIQDIGVFAEDDWTLGRLTLTGGIRIDHSIIQNGYFYARNASGGVLADDHFPDRHQNIWGWRVGGQYALSSALRMRLASYRGLRLPTLNELYRPFVVFPVTTLANGNLKSETLEGYEAGADLSFAPGKAFSFTVFNNRLTDAIANVTIGPNMRQRQNLPRVSAQGLEGDFTWKEGLFSLDISAAYTDAHVVGIGASAPLNGYRPAQSPKLSASATLGIEPARDTRIALTIRHIGRQFEDDLQSDALPAATTLGATAQFLLFGKTAIVLRGENLTGARIVTRNSAGTLDLGVPTTLWAGLRWAF